MRTRTADLLAFALTLLVSLLALAFTAAVVAVPGPHVFGAGLGVFLTLATLPLPLAFRPRRAVKQVPVRRRPVVVTPEKAPEGQFLTPAMVESVMEEAERTLPACLAPERVWCMVLQHEPLFCDPAMQRGYTPDEVLADLLAD